MEIGYHYILCPFLSLSFKGRGFSVMFLRFFLLFKRPYLWGFVCGRIRQHLGQVAFIFSLLFGLDIEVYKLENMKGILFLRNINSFIIHILMYMNMIGSLLLSTPKIWL